MKQATLLMLIIFPFFSYSQLINGDFENIETVNLDSNTTYEKPVSWSYGWQGNYGTEITTDSYSGNYAMKLWSWYFMQSNEELHYGNSPNYGVPISNSPTKLKGFYKFTNPNIQPNNIPDSAYVNVLLTKYNQTMNRRDTISFTEYNLGKQNSYTPFEIELSHLNNQIPDTLRLYFRTTYFNGPSDNTDTSNYLYLDNLSLEYSTTTILEQENGAITIYPNPTEDMVQILSKQKIKKVNIYSLSGKLIKTQIFQNLDYSIQCDLENLSDGLYFLEVIGINSKMIDKVKIVKK